MVQPDLTYLSEALLVSHCFSEAEELGYAISRFMKQLKQQVRSSSVVERFHWWMHSYGVCFQLSSSNPSIASSIGPSALRHIIDYAAHLVLDTDSTFNNPRVGFNIESRCLVTSVLYYFAPQLVTRSKNDDDDNDDDDEELYGDSTNAAYSISWNKLRELLDSYFPSCDADYSRPEDTHDQLLDAIHAQLRERHLQPLPSLIEKVWNAISLLRLPTSIQKEKCFLLLCIN